MKNLIIAVIAIAIAVLVFTQMQRGNDADTVATAESTNNTAPAVSSAAPTVTETAPLIETPTELISPAPEGAAVFFLEPGDGTTVTSPVTVKFGITNMTVVPAGDNTEHSGHHHILIDQTELPDMTQPLPATDKIVHYGLAQTEAELELEPGEHTLQLVLGNYLHIPHDPPVISKKITITVE
ncbi:MAG: DUF4399 domain-containing protein [Acidiferrobacterales bacterium]|nr:DUF4399 domain-containing protein [Acidiferrobacterales bacterium]